MFSEDTSRAKAIQIPAGRREMGAPKKVMPYLTFPLLGLTGCLTSLFALAKVVTDVQFLRKVC